MNTKPKVGSRVYVSTVRGLLKGTVKMHDEAQDTVQDTVQVRWDTGSYTWEDYKNLRRLVKKPNKDKQKIEAMEEYINELTVVSMDQEAREKKLLEENAEMKKVLGGKTYWIGGNGEDEDISDVNRILRVDRDTIHIGWTHHTKVLVLETKAAGEE